MKSRRMAVLAGFFFVMSALARAWVWSGTHELGIDIGRVGLGIEGGSFGIIIPARTRPSVISNQNIGTFTYVRPYVRLDRDPKIILIPIWIVMLLVTLMTVILYRRIRPMLATGCKKCGYDLRADTTGVCPECGTAISEAQKRAIAGADVDRT